MPIDKNECQKFFEKVCFYQKLDALSFEIIVCDDKKSKELNQDYLSMLSPTNVLSFPEESDDTDEINFIGSLVLSIDTLTRESFLYHQEKSDYAKQLLIHGFAHLLGYDHSEEMDIFCDESLEFSKENQ